MTKTFKKLAPGPNILAEAFGLRLLSSTNTIKTPKILSVESNQLETELINTSPPSKKGMQLFARNLANLHKHQVGRSCPGLDHDNYIGSTLQINKNPKNLAWPEFFLTVRLKFQCQLADKKDNTNFWLDTLQKQTEAIISLLSATRQDNLSILHGDLWSGNVIFDQQQTPWLIDPAVYIGHREADIAMTQLFGGFTADFYSEYSKLLPLSPGHQQRFKIYNLYHILNHYNIFGGIYRDQAIASFADFH